MKKLLLATLATIPFITSAKNFDDVEHELTFGAEVDTVCAFISVDAYGDILFNGENSNDDTVASFIVLTNAPSGKVKFSLSEPKKELGGTDLTTSLEVRVDDGNFRDYNGKQRVDAPNNTEVKVQLYAEEERNRVIAGAYKYTTTVTLDCK
jgi:hypothetical protein